MTDRSPPTTSAPTTSRPTTSPPTTSPPTTSRPTGRGGVRRGVRPGTGRVVAAVAALVTATTLLAGQSATAAAPSPGPAAAPAPATAHPAPARPSAARTPSPSPRRAPTSAPATVPKTTRLYVPPADPAALAQIGDLRAGGAPSEAAAVARMIATPQAVWVTSGTPGEVRRSVAATMAAAEKQGGIATLVLYDVPGRDCSHYSAGGAAGTAEYEAWIDGIVAGIGNRAVGVVVEPDGLANLPSDCDQDDTAGTLSAARIDQIRYAATKLTANRRAMVYLDAGSSAWKAVGDITTRLIAAGVEMTNGFALNISSYELDSHADSYGTWVSRCIAYTLHQAGANPAKCASQYSPATPADYSTWHASDDWYAANVTVAPSAHFVVDTSRNGLGPWAPPAGAPAGDPQVWCNPPGRAVGATPTTDTRIPLLDARIWVKTPGQSDGACSRWSTDSTDPARGRVDPAAGAWFPDQALELARLAVLPG